jgi:hypothetical protein
MMLRAAISPVIIAWSWLLYLCMPLRPTSYRLGISRSMNSRITSTARR